MDANLAQYRRQEQINYEGGVLAKPADSYSELARAGDDMTQSGLSLMEQDLKAKRSDQMSRAALEVDKAYEELKKGFTPDNIDEWEAMTDRMHESLGPTMNKILTDGKARDEFSPYFERQKFNQSRSTTSEKRAVEANNYQRNYYRGFVESQDLAAEQSLLAEFNGKFRDQADITFGFKLKEDAKLSGEEITEENFGKYFEPKEGYESPIFESEGQRKSEAVRWYRGGKDKWDTVQKNKLTRELIGTALSAEDGEAIISSANTVAKARGFEFDQDDLDKLESNYRDTVTSAKRLAKENLEDLQQKNERAFDLRLGDPENKNPVTVTDVDEAYANGDIDQTAWKGFRKLIAEGPVKENDDEALMQMHEFENQVRKGEITSREGLNKIRELKGKVKSTEYDSVVAGLPKLYEGPEHIKTYFSLLDGWRTMGLDGNPLGDNNLEIAKNYNLYHKALTDWFKINPNATLEQADAAFKKIVGEPEAKKWFWKSVGKFFTPPPVHAVRAARLISEALELKKAIAKAKAKAKKAEYKAGDKRTINGVTYTFDGQFWKD